MSAKDVIIALDFPTREETLSFLDRFPAGEKPFVKIGMELFYAEGPQVVRDIKARGHKIFLDLKLHDIPNTVKRAMAVLSRLDVDMVNLHAAGTSEMMLAGASAVEIGAANLRDPYACKKIIEDLPGVCERLGVERIADLTGAAHG